MSLVRILADLRGGFCCVDAFGLLLIVAALVPLAHASPPDPVWIAGIYDDADFDDVVVAVISAAGLVEMPVVLAMPADISSAAVPLDDVVLDRATPLCTFSVRAPPFARVIAAT